MRTSKPVSTISYNSKEFLSLKLEELRNAGIISEWYFIQHSPEHDELKKHIHLYLMPSKMIQTDDLIKEFYEPDPDKPGKFLTCPRWQSSKFADWYLYGLHDAAYLASKGQSRFFHYRHCDFSAFDSDAFSDAVREIDFTALTAIKRMQDAIQQGLSFAGFLRRGGVPIQAVNQYKAAWDLLKADNVQRAGRISHDEPIDVNEDTGELL